MRYAESPVLPCGKFFFVTYRIYPGYRRAAAQPVLQGFKLFFRAFRPNFHIPVGGISDPAGKAKALPLVHTGLTETHTLNTAFYPGKKSRGFIAFFIHGIP